MSKKQLKIKQTRNLNLSLFIMTLPTILWLFLFKYLPMPGIVLAFKNFRIFPGKGFFGNLMASEWVGLYNIKALFASTDSGLIIRNTIGYNLIFITLGVITSMALAIILHEMLWKKLTRFYQTITLFPFFLSWVVVSFLVYALFSNQDGLVNNIIERLGGSPIQWYSAPKAWSIILVAVHLWKWTGYNSIIYLASVTSIDPGLYDAAFVDGAGKWKQTRYITIPLMLPIMTVLVLLSLGTLFASDFGLFYQVPRNTGALYPATNVIDTYIYRALTQRGDISLSAATGAVQSAVGFILVFTANMVIRKAAPERSLF
jgi:putative aldouronate transport system permease protein